MPYINSILTSKLSDEKKEIIRKELSSALQNILDKGEEWLFVRFEDNQVLYFRGQKSEYAAIIELKLIGSPTNDAKTAFCAKVCEIFSNQADIKPEDIYIIFTEVKNSDWGWNGGLF